MIWYPTKKRPASNMAAQALSAAMKQLRNVATELTRLLEDKDRHVRMCAADALGQMGPAAGEAVPQLIRALDDEEWEAHCSAAEALEKMRASPALSLENLAAWLARADARKKAHGTLLQFALSFFKESEDVQHAAVRTAVCEAILKSWRTEVVRSAVKAFPRVLWAANLSTLDLRALVQRALRLVPDVAVECKLHLLLDGPRADNPAETAEPANSLPDSEGFGFVSSGYMNAGATLSNCFDT